MTVNLSWLLGREQLGLRLVEGHAGSAATIRFAHAIELEDPTPWLDGGELVLTTGLRLSRARAEQAAYVERLAQADVAALAFGIGVRFDTIPHTVQDTCRDVGLPLVEVPLPTPFVAITQAVAARLAEQQNESMRHAVTFQQDMTKAALDDGTHGLVNRLALELNCRTLLLDEHQVVLSPSTPPTDLTDWVRHELAKVPPHGSRTGINVVGEHGSLEIQRLGDRTRSRGWLAVDSAEPLRPADRLLLNHAVSLITLQLDRPRELTDAHRRLGTTVLGLLLDSDLAEPSVADQLRHVGFEPGDQVSVILAAGRDSRSLLAPVSSWLETYKTPYVLAYRPAGVVVLVRDFDADEVANTLSAALRELGHHDATLGVSGSLNQNHVRSGMTAAAHAVESARWERKRIGWYESFTLEAILGDETVRDRIRALAETSLTSLLDTSTTRDADLVESLEMFLRHNGSWEAASRALGVHRHTLRNRMARVEELTGMSLDVAQNRVVLLLALMTRSR